MCLFAPPAVRDTYCAMEDRQAELTLVAGNMPRWFSSPQTVTNPSTNRSRCRLTARPPLSQTACTKNNGEKVNNCQFPFGAVNPLNFVHGKATPT